jgi:hypothetical protein
MIKPIVVPWHVPNKSKESLLHIADRGARLSTVTGITWLNDSFYLLAHQVGCMVALFDIKDGNQPLKSFEIPHLIDDITSRKTGTNIWEVTVSGCWEVVTTTFELNLTNDPELNTTSTRAHKDKTFSHGVRYINNQLCIAFSTGKDPRIEISDRIYRLPTPLCARCVCFDETTGSYYVIAGSNTPKQKLYTESTASVWILNHGSEEWVLKYNIKNSHSDACEIYQDRIWLPDQKNDRVLGLCLKDKNKPIIINGKCFDFPHGLSISPSGTLGVTNYGNSTAVLIDLNEVIRLHNEYH